MLSAFRILNATRNNRMSCAVVALCARSNVREVELLGSSRFIEESLPTFVEDSEVGVDDIAPQSRRESHHYYLVFGQPDNLEVRTGPWLGQTGIRRSPTCT